MKEIPFYYLSPVTVVVILLVITLLIYILRRFALDLKKEDADFAFWVEFARVNHSILITPKGTGVGFVMGYYVEHLEKMNGAFLNYSFVDKAFYVQIDRGGYNVSELRKRLMLAGQLNALAEKLNQTRLNPNNGTSIS